MTTKQIEEIRRRNEAGESDAMISEALGINSSYVSLWRRSLGLEPQGIHKHRTRYVYFIWDSKTDELLFVGRASECAEFLGYTAIQSFYALASRSKHKRRNTYYILKEELKDE